MKKIILLITCLLIGLNILAQSEAANWYFGYNAGIRFNQANNTISNLSDGQLATNEGSASISDDTGNLLFYTDGSTVFNKSHEIMMNGSGLFGDESSTQSAIIVPKPNDATIYYIFTVDNNLDNQNYGLNYSEVDMSLDGGLGAVIQKNSNLLSLCSEKITAVLKDCITKSIWVVTFASEDGNSEIYNTYHAYEVTDLGINTTSVKSTFNIEIFDGRGYLKLSPDGTKMASANAQDGLFLYDFDTTSGIVSNQQSITLKGISKFPYGVEFSPNSQLLYAHASNDYFSREISNNENPANHKSTLLQFNLLSLDIPNSEFIVDNRELYRGGLQLGPDGKIYRALSATYFQGLPYLGVIQNPDNIGAACNYRHNAINLSPNKSSQGLPPFIASFFNTEIDIIKNGESQIGLSLCEGDTYTLSSEKIPNATYIWTKDGNILSETNFELDINESGHYELYIDPNNGDCAIEGQAYVVFNENPEAFDANLLQCDDDVIADGLTIFSLNEANNEITNGIPDLSTKFYTDINRTNQVNAEAFYNSINPQIIYVEVINDNSGCSNYAELTLRVSNTDSNDTDLVVCDDDGIEDGFYDFNLNNTEADIIAGLPTGLNLTYYKTYEDALLEVNNLAIDYTNEIPYSQTIYARVENENNCYGISEVQLIVNKLPNIINGHLTYYCLNSFPETITLNAGIIDDSPNNYSYLWSNGDTTYETDVNAAGTYTVSIINNNDCIKENTIIVEASNIASFKSIEVVDVSSNNSVNIFVSGEGSYEYALYDENNTLYMDFQEASFFENVFPGIYTVHVKDIKNDCGLVTDDVSVIGFPKFFTPNNDGFHDTWQVYGVSSMFQPNSKIRIYNRYGKLIKQLNPLGEGWDGLLNGEKLPTDDYWFFVTLQDGRTFKNHFTLKN